MKKRFLIFNEKFSQIFDGFNYVRFKSLGIKHDYFFSENCWSKTKLLKNLSILKKNNFIENGYLEPPKGDDNTKLEEN